MVTGRLRLASISFVVLFGVLAVGCGDDTPAQPDGGTGGSGSGGSGGHAGDAGIDSKDADAKVDSAETGDVITDRADTGETGDVQTDRSETADVPADHAETGDVPADGNTDAPGDTSEVARACFMVAFVKPLDQATLTAADDKDGDLCANGFQYDVKINSADAPDGTDVSLFASNVMVATAKIAAGAATFSAVQLPTGDTSLSIQFPSTVPCTDATTKAKVTVNCNVPACTISKPAHATLNGIPVGNGGDRISPDGSPYQTAFEVTTNIDDGRTVALKIDNAASPATVSTVSGTATSGKAMFGGVTLAPDGTYEVVAQCTDKNGVVGSSMKGTFTVDTTPPNLTISKPANGAFFGPTDLTAGKFKVCGQTTATDAVNLAPSLGARATNFCITGTTNCAAVAAVGTDACVDFTCPGGAPFDISVTLNDGAGNTTNKTITGVSCSSTLPTVRIVNPVSDAPTFSDPSKHILNGTGAQTNVKACSDRSGMAQLFVGHAGDASLVTLGSAVATVAAGANECPAGLGFVANFPGVTLPESTENASGALTAATELRVDLTDLSTATGSSTPLDVWVDTVKPVISLLSPGALCGSFQQAVGTFTTDVALNSDTATVTLTVTNGASTVTHSNPTVVGGVATFTAVNFDQGQNSLAAVATDPAGNMTALAPCTVTVGGAPAVSFSTPLITQQLCASGSTATGCIDDTDTGTAGWQGSITAHVTVGGVALGSTNVTFSIGATTLGTAMLNVNGDATLAITTNVVPEGPAVTFTATTDDVPAHGIGVGTVTVNVDTLPPDAVTVLAVGMQTNQQRRQSSFPLTWNAPDDHGRNVAGYQVRVAKVKIDDTNFDQTAANQSNPLLIVTKDIPFTGMPHAVGVADAIVVPDLNIELGYFFAVAAVDAAGNRGPIVATSSAQTANFLPTVLTGPGAGFTVDTGDFGSPDGTFTKDKLSDLLVGSRGGNTVWIYFGTAAGYSLANATTITIGARAVSTLAVANVGDIDGDKLDDIAVSSSVTNAASGDTIWIFSRKSPNFGASWPTGLNEGNAKYTITVQAGSLFSGKLSQRPISRLGNFDADVNGIEDFAVGFSGFTGGAGQKGSVLVIKGSGSFPATLTIPEVTPTNTIEIDGTAANSFFGATLVGLGQFFSAAAGSTLMVGDTGNGTAYAFAGPMTTASQVVTDAAHTDYTRTVGVLGPLGGSPNGVTIASTVASHIDIHIGTALGGPFNTSGGTNSAAKTTLTDSAASNSFGAVNLGGGVRGTTGSVSVIGDDSIPDLIVGGLTEAGVTNAGPLYIINGTAISSLPPGNLDVSTIGPTALGTGVIPIVVKVNNQIPPPSVPGTWGGYAGTTVLPDLNGDGFGDFAIGETATAPTVGRVVVFY